MYSSRQFIFVSFGKRKGEVEVFFIPFWVPFASTLGAKAERRQSEGRVEALCVPTIYSYTKKTKNQGATFEKKRVAQSGTW